MKTFRRFLGFPFMMIGYISLIIGVKISTRRNETEEEMTEYAREFQNFFNLI